MFQMIPLCHRCMSPSSDLNETESIMKAILLSWIIIYPCTLNAQSINASYQAKYHTITHEILKSEQSVSKNSNYQYDQMLKLLDDLIEGASLRIKGAALNSLTPQQKARSILKLINETIINFKFKLNIGTQTISEMLTNRTADCDTGSMLYIAIAQALGLPIFMVEVPNHNFVRYYYEDAEYINWDSNTALYDANLNAEYSDSDYMNAQSLTCRSCGFTVDDAVESHYLQPMSNDWIRGYFYSLTNSLKPLVHNEARIIFEKSLSIRPFSHLAMNNFSWFLLTNKSFAGNPNDQELALKLAIQATQLKPYDSNYIDTLGCAYAANGDFDKAEQYESTGGGNDNDQIKGYRNKRTCFQQGLD